jgi:hypothetical protein
VQGEAEDAIDYAMKSPFRNSKRKKIAKLNKILKSISNDSWMTNQTLI